MIGVGPVAVPAAERLTARGPPLVLPAMNSVAVRMPVARGVKITWMVHLVPAATVGPQEVLSEKSPPSVPPIMIAERFNATVAALVNWIACAAPAVPTTWLAKLKLVVDSTGDGASVGLATASWATVIGRPATMMVVCRAGP